MPDDNLPMNFEFPVQSKLDHMAKNDPEALKALELAAILHCDMTEHFFGGNYTWNFILNDGQKS